jgi:hypothetical protein
MNGQVDGTENQLTLLKLAAILILIAVFGPLFWSFRLVPESDFIVSVTAFSIGVVTFFGIAHLNRSAADRRIFREDSLRTAIACSLVITYLFIVCFSAFVRSAETAGMITKEFVQSFSQVIGITIAFYFGASAATQIFGKRGDNGQAARSVEQKEPGQA